MATTYACDHCGATATNLTEWFIVAVHFLFDNPGVTQAPGGRTLQASAPDLLFDTIECRQAWCEQAGVTDPGPLAVGLRGAPA